MLGSLFILVAVCAALLHSTTAALIANETSTALIISNARLFASLNKSTGAIDTLRLDGQDLLGSPAQLSGGTNRRGRLYLDCHCVPSGFYTPGTIAAKYKLIKGTDGNNIPYGGIVLSEVYPPTGQILEQYWFLKEDETGLHSFSRLVYKNATAPYLRNLGEFRTLFRPDSELWTHMSTNEGVQAPIPDPEVLSESPVVQDATWYLGDHKDEPYVKETADYFTKYTFGDIWRDHYVHGLYSDGSTSSDGSTYGAWLVMNTRDTYYGGPLHGDLVVDGIVYNYLVSNHWGGPTPNITNGFDRTFGPFYYYFNKGSSSTRLGDLRQDALEYASPTWNIDFYDSIAQHVPNYVSTANRGTFKVRVRLPEGAIRPLAVLSQNKADFQDNANDTSAYQYWADIDTNSGEVTISRVKGGTYRLTIYAEGIFGEYVQDDVAVKAGATNDLGTINWTPENAGYEVWRIGVPDKSSGEYRHGYQKDLTHPGQLQQYRIYWGVYDFPSDFPEGVLFKVGQSKEAEDFNYIHWSVFGGTGNDHRPVCLLMHRCNDPHASVLNAKTSCRTLTTATAT